MYSILLAEEQRRGCQVLYHIYMSDDEAELIFTDRRSERFGGHHYAFFDISDTWVVAFWRIALYVISYYAKLSIAE